MVLPGVLRGLLAPRLATTVTKSTTSKPCRPRGGTPRSLAHAAYRPDAVDHGGVRGTSGSGAGISGSGSVVVDGSGVGSLGVVCTGGTVVVDAGGTVMVSAGGTVIVSAGFVVVLVSVGVAGSGELCSPPKSVVPRPPPDVALPDTSSGTVMITAQTRNPSSPVMIAIRQERAGRA